MFCKDDDREKYCNIYVTTQLMHGKEKKCPSTREEIVQAVFGVLDEEDATNPCQYRITRENWRNIIRIPVKASIDSLKDKNQKRDIRVDLHFKASNILFYSVQLGMVEVGSVFVTINLCVSVKDGNV